MATKKTDEQATDTGLYVSRSEKKRLAKNIEQIARELVELPPAEIKKLPCSDLIKAEIGQIKGLKTGALKRQIKHIAGILREDGADPILAFLAERRGSHLKQDGEFHQLERLREEIISEVLRDREEARRSDQTLNESWQSETVLAALVQFPSLDPKALKISALRYAATRKPVHRREIFRQLAAAMERERFPAAQQASENEPP